MKILTKLSQLNSFIWRHLVDLSRPIALTFGVALGVFMVVIFGDVDVSDLPKPVIGVVQRDTPAQTQIVDLLEESGLYRLNSNSKETLENELIRLEIDPRETMYAYLDITEQEVTIYARTGEEEIATALSRVVENINGQTALAQYEGPRPLLSSGIRYIVAATSTYLDYTMPGLLGITLITSCVYGAASSLQALFSTGVIESIFLAPVSPALFFLGGIVARTVFSILQVLVVFVVAWFVYDYSAVDGLWSIFQTILVMFPASLMLLSIGYCIAGSVSDGDKVNSIANTIVVPQMLLSGTFIPVSDFDPTLGSIAKVLPLYQVNEAVREITINGYNVWDAPVLQYIAIMLLWTLGLYLITLKNFKIQ